MAFLSAHRWLLVAFVALALLIEAPLIAFPFYAGERYEGINIAHFGNDEHHYLSRGKEILEGNALGQMYLKDGKELPDSFQSNIEQILVTPVRILGGEGINVVTLYNVMNAIGIFFLLILMYLFAHALSKNTLVAAVSALFAVGGYVLIENGTLIGQLLTGKSIIYGNFNIFGRSAFPYMALVPLLGFLFLAYRAVVSEFQTISRGTLAPYFIVAGAGALLGLLFYDYFYAWSWALAFLGSLTLFALVLRRWNVAAVACAIGAIGVAIGSFKLVEYYRVFTSPLGEQFTYFFMAIHSRAFIESTTGIAVLLLFVLYLYFRRTDPPAFFVFAVIAANWIVLEQQLITGRTVQYGHYYWYFVVPLSIIVSFYMLSRLIPPSLERWGKYIFIGLIVLAFANTAAGQYRSFSSTELGKLREQQFAPVLEKLRNMPKTVVLGDPGGASYPFLVTIYTDHDLYWLPAAITSAFSPDHLKEALLVYLYINKDSRRDPRSYLREVLASTTPSIYGDMYEILEGFHAGIDRRKYEKVPPPHTDPEILAARETYLPEIVNEYRVLTQDPRTVRKTLEESGVRYVLWDQQQNPEWDLSGLGKLMVVATSTDIILYELSTTR